MNSLIKLLENEDKFNKYINDINSHVDTILLSGLTNGGKMHFSYATKFFTNKLICIVTYNEIQARKLIKDLKYYTKQVYFFPKREITSYDYIAESKEALNERVECLTAIHNNKAEVVVTTIQALMQKTITSESLYRSILEIEVGKEYLLDEIKEELVNLGYERFDLVEGKGQFSIRGGIIDIAISRRTRCKNRVMGR